MRAATCRSSFLSWVWAVLPYSIVQAKLLLDFLPRKELRFAPTDALGRGLGTAAIFDVVEAALDQFPEEEGLGATAPGDQSADPAFDFGIEANGDSRFAFSACRDRPVELPR